MSKRGGFLKGILFGAGIMYLLDPRTGKKRRQMIKEKGIKSASKAGHVVHIQLLDLWHRFCGVIIETKHRLEESYVSNDLLEARVRSSIGHATRHPSKIKVVACEGVVELSGTISQKESQALIHRARHVRGVKKIKNNLTFSEAAS